MMLLELKLDQGIQEGAMETLMKIEIPTRLFRVAGIKGTFSVDRKPVQFIGGKTGYQATWSTSGANYKFKTASGATRENALNALVVAIEQDYPEMVSK